MSAGNVGSLDELNELVDRWDTEDDGRRIRKRARTVGEYFTHEQGLLTPLPAEPFESNLVCDRTTLVVAWERVSGNRGARTAGVDAVTRY
ncbi:hypothetical protein ABZS86_34600 [Streptomyces sp. NPDC005355]|uniref:hypothetical protein n=1 Tax=Streptomyces sp. NPDC005355 TaxID=3157038 RepID=UPI0033A50195